ncbi:conserved membrane protein of unknown function [Sterolibacterium denitrificans]|uniref:Uncharacterized protein n=1 Tax=Sterolibacterium denitrificans TaxID=157592 RepID=A0A7Z7HRU2_9PROT|nr:hypothetical protein [Sterolibacterium denitrificans]SMB26528.1 conserved membrane protein of unknown function [Sterolibacterium denitrificans]
MSKRLFSPPPRLLPGQRWLNISLRCLHLIGVAGVGGGFLFDLPEAQWQPFWTCLMTSGCLLVALYIWTDIAWLRQLKGQAIVLKLGLLGMADLLPQWRTELFLLVIVLSAFFAHAPGWLRGYVLWRRLRGTLT